MAKSIKEITEIIDKFGDERGWANNDPNQLISSILIELAELAEHYQWQDKFRKLSKKEEIEIGYEFVDIIVYLFRLASKSGIDIEKYFDEKLPKLEKKFPVNQTKRDYFKAHEEYRKAGKNKAY